MRVCSVDFVLYRLRYLIRQVQSVGRMTYARIAINETRRNYTAPATADGGSRRVNDARRPIIPV